MTDFTNAMAESSRKSKQCYLMVLNANTLMVLLLRDGRRF